MRLLGFGEHQVYPGVGADIVSKSSTSVTGGTGVPMEILPPLRVWEEVADPAGIVRR